MYISTREMVISIICNACGVLSLILWAIEAYKSEIKLNEIAFIRGQLMALSASEKDEPQTETHELRTETHECVKDEPQDWKDQMWTEAIEDEPQTERSEE